MSKGIFLYSEDKKYKCAFELCDTLDKHQIPDHSVMILFEEREDGNYVIAEARDKILTTEKDLLIASLELEKSDLVREKADLEEKLAESERKIEELKGERLKFYTDDVRRTQVINGVHFDIEQLLVFSEYVEHEKWVEAEYEKEIDKLKQQLAEKEEDLIIKCRTIGVLVEKTEKYNQDKISFCIEQFEKVKEYADIDYRKNCYINAVELDKYIDKLIAEIKGE